LSPNRSHSQAGFTLVEVILALMIMAMIAMLSAQAFNTAASSSAATREAMKRLAEIDRAFVLIETDLRNAIPKEVRDGFGTALPPLLVSSSEDYWMTVMRGGLENPLFLPRTEEVRVGYRYVDNEIWRDTWFNPRLTDQDEAKEQRILTDVKEMRVRVLSNTATSIAAGPWVEDWPPSPGVIGFPHAIEVTLELEDMGEITRLFSMLPGAGNPALIPGQPGGAPGGGLPPGQQPGQDGMTPPGGLPGQDPNLNPGGGF
jgi:general secretion pathway protein J